MVWGVYPLLLPKPVDNSWVLEVEVSRAIEMAMVEGFLDSRDDLVTVTAGLPFYGNDPVACPTNALRVVSANSAKQEISAMGIKK